MYLGEKIFILDELSSLHNPFIANISRNISISTHDNLTTPLLITISTRIASQINFVIYNN